jgi:hypothetical protein
MAASSTAAGNATFKAVGISLAVGSGYLVRGVAFADGGVVCLSGLPSCCMSSLWAWAFLLTDPCRKKRGLLQANARYKTNPGEGMLLLVVVR